MSCHVLNTRVHSLPTLLPYARARTWPFISSLILERDKIGRVAASRPRSSIVATLRRQDSRRANMARSLVEQFRIITFVRGCNCPRYVCRKVWKVVSRVETSRPRATPSSRSRRRSPDSSIFSYYRRKISPFTRISKWVISIFRTSRKF